MPANSNPPGSANFGFLAKHDALLVTYGALAERYVFEDPNSALIKLGQFGELLAQRTAAMVGVFVSGEDSAVDVLANLWDRGVLTREVSQLFHGLRKARNKAVHQHAGDRREALHQLRMARTLGVWFHKSFGKDPHFKAGPFFPPPAPAQAEQALQEELERLRLKLTEQHAATAEAQQAAAKAKQEADQAYADMRAALELAEETEAEKNAAIRQYEQRLALLQAETAAAPREQVQEAVQEAYQLGESLDLDEADTRKIIDAQLVEAGWTADTQKLTFAKGTRPQKGKNLAIAEWPTDHGPADYVLFTGLTPLAVVEAKRKRKDVSGALEQAKRYSRGYKATADETLPAGGPWAKYRIPFMFATNGRPYLKQLATKSGIWFLDGRRPTNHGRPLDGWYTPAGLTQLFKQDFAAAEHQLETEPTDYLPLRYYQHESLARSSERISLMSGTPLENRPSEFVNLVRICDESLAGRLSSHAEARTPRRFETEVAPVYLRRNQNDVLNELPECLMTDEWVTLPSGDHANYRSTVFSTALMTMRRAATGNDLTGGKFQRLRELLEQHRDAGNKVIVFSYFLEVLSHVGRLSGRHHRIDGSVSPQQRMGVIDSFSNEEGFAVMACQIEAGGVGINLQAASVVVLMEPQLKPTTEWQAIKRVHRMGQTRRVVVHRLISRDTVEESLLDRLEEKSKLFDAYARESAVKRASPAATDTANVSLEQQLIQAELQRVGAA